jgi:hypothetical protein
MRKRLASIIVAMCMLLTASLSWAAGSCTQTPYRSTDGNVVMIQLLCTDSNPAGGFTTTISAENMNLIKWKYYLYSVTTYPTSGGTAPDAADVTVNMSGQDLLGAKGASLIHASATQDILPYSAFMTGYRFPAVIDDLTVGVSNQGKASANFTIDLLFVR